MKTTRACFQEYVSERNAAPVNLYSTHNPSLLFLEYGWYANNVLSFIFGEAVYSPANVILGMYRFNNLTPLRTSSSRDSSEHSTQEIVDFLRKGRLLCSLARIIMSFADSQVPLMF